MECLHSDPSTKCKKYNLDSASHLGFFHIGMCQILAFIQYKRQHANLFFQMLNAISGEQKFTYISTHNQYPVSTTVKFSLLFDLKAIIQICKSKTPLVFKVCKHYN